MELKHSTKIRVRYADTDKMGIVYNGNYLSYFETGRTELMREFGLPYTKVESSGYLLPLIDAYVRYHAPAEYDDIVEVEAKLEMDSPSRIKFNYFVTCNEKKIASGYTRHIFVNSENMKPVKPPKMFTKIVEGL